jgi:hypothetical protein
MEKRPSSSIQLPICSSKHLPLLGISILGVVIISLMQLILGTEAQLAALSRITAVGIGLWLISKEGCEENARPAPKSICPLEDFNLVCKCIPSFQGGGQALVRDDNPPAGSACRTILWPPSPDSFLLVEDRNHANHQPTSRFSAHIIV